MNYCQFVRTTGYQKLNLNSRGFKSLGTSGVKEQWKDERFF